MSGLVRGWRGFLVGLVLPIGLVLVACSSGPGVSSREHNATASEEPAGYITINVDMTDNDIQPPRIFIPVGQRVQLVMRNRGTTEHHYKVLGLVPRDPMWLARARPGVTDDEHMAHHSGADFVDINSLMLFEMCTSVAGVCPKANEVHAYAQGGGLDAMFFTATRKGTFSVQCPIHPEIAGKVTVY